jgi:hypothetical protein
MHTMRREHEYEKYSKLLGRRIVCCVAQPDFFWLVCTCGAQRSIVYRVHRQEKGCPLVRLHPGAANAGESKFQGVSLASQTAPNNACT